MLTKPRYITVNRSGEKIYVSDWSTHTITCMSVDGRKEFSMGEPRGLLCDSEDDILVCGLFSRCVQVLKADGKRHCTLLTESGVINTPVPSPTETLIIPFWSVVGIIVSF